MGTSPPARAPLHTRHQAVAPVVRVTAICPSGPVTGPTQPHRLAGQSTAPQITRTTRSIQRPSQSCVSQASTTLDPRRVRRAEWRRTPQRSLIGTHDPVGHLRTTARGQVDEPCGGLDQAPRTQGADRSDTRVACHATTQEQGPRHIEDLQKLA